MASDEQNEDFGVAFSVIGHVGLDLFTFYNNKPLHLETAFVFTCVSCRTLNLFDLKHLSVTNLHKVRSQKGSKHVHLNMLGCRITPIIVALVHMQAKGSEDSPAEDHIPVLQREALNHVHACISEGRSE